MIITNRHGYPQAIVNMAKHYYEQYIPTPKQISATTLLKPIRQIILERRYYDQISMDVSEMRHLLDGQAKHHMLEFHDHTLKAELKLKVLTKNGYTLSGVLDLYALAPDLVSQEWQHYREDERPLIPSIIDYKNTSVRKSQQECHDWKMQLLLYAWLAKENKMEVKQGIDYALLKDWEEEKAGRLNYPLHWIEAKPLAITDTRLEWIENFINTKLELIKQHEETLDEELPLCTEEERWKEKDSFIVKRVDGKRAIRDGTFTTYEEALPLLNAKNERAKTTYYVIEKREGKPNRCLKYCGARTFCPYYKQLMFGDIDIPLPTMEEEESE
jgi:hypothetical protein